MLFRSVDSINRAQVATHVEWYADPVPVFYNGRNLPRREALAIRVRTLSEATRIEVRTSEPEIRVEADARTATMVFRERYVFEGPRIHRRGTVIQELRWRKTGAGWRIIGERTLRELSTKQSSQSKRS